MNTTKYLIVNADDFGQSQGVNRGIIEAYEKGIVTSASLMVRWPAVEEAVAYSQKRNDISLGLHLDLGEWIYREDNWEPLYEVVPRDDAAMVADELRRQVSSFQRMTGKSPTHLDSHQHVHMEEPARSIVRQIAEELGVPLRNCSAVRYCGSFYGQTAEGSPLPELITADALAELLRQLEPGFTELGCHPGLDNDLDTMYRDERSQETAVLCDGRIRAVIDEMGIELCSFNDIAC